jgi:hypothetical protein
VRTVIIVSELQGGPSVVSHGDVLRDDALDDEIALVGELVVAATHSEGPLSLDQIDRALGLR